MQVVCDVPTEEQVLTLSTLKLAKTGQLQVSRNDPVLVAEMEVHPHPRAALLDQNLHRQESCLRHVHYCCSKPAVVAAGDHNLNPCGLTATTAEACEPQISNDREGLHLQVSPATAYRAKALALLC